MIEMMTSRNTIFVQDTQWVVLSGCPDHLKNQSCHGCVSNLLSSNHQMQCFPTKTRNNFHVISHFIQFSRRNRGLLIRFIKGFFRDGQGLIRTNGGERQIRWTMCSCNMVNKDMLLCIASAKTKPDHSDSLSFVDANILIANGPKTSQD